MAAELDRLAADMNAEGVFPYIADELERAAEGLRVIAESLDFTGTQRPG